MAINKFDWPKYEDFKVLNAEGKVVGKIRIKPSGILWSPTNKPGWYGVTLEQFAEFAMTKVKKQDT